MRRPRLLLTADAIGGVWNYALDLAHGLAAQEVETVLAPVWVWMVFDEVPSGRSLTGGAILIVALVAHSLWQLHEGRRRRAALAPRHPA